jgi:preprotein translocase subunit SecD
MTIAIFEHTVTLTLAGIAGFILSIGMAVDANILIFERTKEELREGKSFFNAIEAGFDRAFTSIFDSNVNTLIACFVLLIFGTGLVRGFAIALAIGVLVSMFSAIYVTKTLLSLATKVEAFRKPELFGVRG